MMQRIFQTCCCAVVALGIGLVGLDARGQLADGPRDLFGPTPAMHRAPADQPPQPFCHCVGDDDSASVAKIRKALAGPLHQGGLVFDGVALEDVVNVIREEYDILVLLDTPALADVGLVPEEPVTVNLHNITLRSALRIMLKTLQLTYVIRDEVLMITTPDEAETELVTCVYDVRDLSGADSGKPDLDSIVSALVSTIATNTWAENGGGEATICPMPSGLLVVSQIEAVHEEIGQLLRALRAAGPAPSPAAQAAGDAPRPGEGEVVTRFFTLPWEDRERSGPQLVHMIRELMPGQQWEGTLGDGSHVLLMALPDRLVVRQRPSVMRQVEVALMDAGVVPRPSRPGMSHGRRGGSGGGGGQGMFSPPVEDDPFGF